MTNDEIDTLPAGAEMDKLVHEMVFGRRAEFRAGSPIGRKLDPDGTWATVYGQDYYFDPDDTTLYLHATDGFTGMIPNYSTRIVDAWRVAEKLKSLHIAICISESEDGWSVEAYSDKDTPSYWCLISESDGNISLSLCRAALKAINHVPNTQAQ